MIRKKCLQQPSLFDPLWFMGERRKKSVTQSWAGLFRTEILPYLPVEKLARCYKKEQGRPSKELYSILGTMLLQQQFDLTDEETVEQYSYNLKWQYALHLDEDESDNEKYLCERTLWTIRQKMMAKGLDTDVFYAVLERLRQIFPVETDKQRLDSVHVSSNMKRLGRVRLFSRTISLFLRQLQKKDGESWARVPAGMVERYLSKRADQVFSQVKPSESEAKLQDLANDLALLLKHYEEDKVALQLKGYPLMLRLYHDQCRPTPATDAVEVKKPQEISGGSLQNPSDPDAGYSGHKGRGYSAQIMETYQTDKPADCPNLITYAEVTAADQHDGRALAPALQKAGEQNVKPVELLTDAHYGSDENCEQSKAQGVEVVAPIMSPVTRKSMQLSDFESDENGCLTRCPEGQAVQFCREGKQGEHMTARFDKAVCEKCPRLKKCLVKVCRRVARLAYKKHGLKSSLRRAREQEAVFREKYRYRSGVEATMSALDRLTGIKRLRVRGLPQVRYCVKLKAAGLNILRAAAARAAKGLEKALLAAKASRLARLIQYFCRSRRTIDRMGILSRRNMCRCGQHAIYGIFADAPAA